MSWETNTTTHKPLVETPLSKMMWDLHEILLKFVPYTANDSGDSLLASLLLATSNAYTAAIQTALTNPDKWLTFYIFTINATEKMPLDKHKRIDTFLKIHERARVLKLLEFFQKS